MACAVDCAARLSGFLGWDGHNGVWGRVWVPANAFGATSSEKTQRHRAMFPARGAFVSLGPPRKGDSIYRTEIIKTSYPKMMDVFEKQSTPKPLVF